MASVRRLYSNRSDWIDHGFEEIRSRIRCFGCARSLRNGFYSYVWNGMYIVGCSTCVPKSADDFVRHRLIRGQR
jgi:hypothetical protein